MNKYNITFSNQRFNCTIQAVDIIEARAKIIAQIHYKNTIPYMKGGIPNKVARELLNSLKINLAKKDDLVEYDI